MPANAGTRRSAANAGTHAPCRQRWQPATDVLDLVTALQAAYNQGDTSSLMALFVAEPNWSLGLGMFGAGGNVYAATTAQNVRDTLQIGFELNSQLEASDCAPKNDQAACTLVIKDDCNPPTASAYHLRAQFVFQAGKIASVYGRWDSNEETAFAVYDAARQEWARENLPAETAAYNSYLSWDDDLAARLAWRRVKPPAISARP